MTEILHDTLNTEATNDLHFIVFPTKLEDAKVALNVQPWGCKEWSFCSNGVSVRIEESAYSTEYWVKGVNISPEGKSQFVGEIDFSPLGVSDYKMEATLQFLTMGYKGIGDFLERMNEPQKFPEEERLPYETTYLAGTTNFRMAEIAVRFGFEIVDDFGLTQEEIETKKGEVQVLGEIEDIKRAYEKFKKSKLGERILARAIREGVVKPLA